MKRLAIAIFLTGTLAGCCHNWCCGPSAPAPASYYYGQPQPACQPCPTGCVPAATAPCTPAVTYSQPACAQPPAAYAQPQARPALPPVQVH
jgi:hypothetical protein